MNQILVTGNINKPNQKKENNPKNNSGLGYNNINTNNNSIEPLNRDSILENNTKTFNNIMPISENQETYNNDYNNDFNINNNSSFDYSSAKREKINVSSIVRIFAITIIIFGVFLLGNGALAISQNNKQNASRKVPEVLISRKGNVLNLSIKSEIPLRSIGYAWNSDEMHFVSAKENTEFELPINIIDGEDNKLNIAIVDMSNKKTYYKEKYSKAPDSTKPEIIISNEDPRIKITVKDDTALDHVVYKYGDNNEQTIYADSEDPTTIEIYIDEVETDQKTLTVEAIDTSQNSEVVSQEVKGTTKPVIEIKKVSEEDPSVLQISITCEDNLQKIVIYLDDKRYSTPDNISIDKKQFTQKVKVNNGTTIKVNAYNVSEKMTEKTITYTYE